MQIVAQKSPTLNNFDHALRPCPTAAELAHLESTARSFLRMDDTARRSAASIRAFAAVARKKHRHIAGCCLCLINEAMANASPRKRISSTSGAITARKLVVNG
jgi:hypothetical protein